MGVEILGLGLGLNRQEDIGPPVPSGTVNLLAATLKSSPDQNLNLDDFQVDLINVGNWVRSSSAASGILNSGGGGAFKDGSGSSPLHSSYRIIPASPPTVISRICLNTHFKRTTTGGRTGFLNNMFRCSAAFTQDNFDPPDAYACALFVDQPLNNGPIEIRIKSKLSGQAAVIEKTVTSDRTADLGVFGLGSPWEINFDDEASESNTVDVVVDFEGVQAHSYKYNALPLFADPVVWFTYKKSGNKNDRHSQFLVIDGVA